MNIVLLTVGKIGEPAVQQLRLQAGTASGASARAVHLLILDSRRMSSICLDAAFTEVALINRTLGINHGVLICPAATLNLTVAAIRAGLHDLVHETLSARRLRALLKNASPATRVGAQEFKAVAAFLRTLGGSPATQSSDADLARREQALLHRGEQLANIEKRLTFDRDALEARDRELHESSRRLERTLALQQTDADLTPEAEPSFAPSIDDLQALAKRLDQRAAELDFREKLLLEMQGLLTAQASVVRSTVGV
ncbi:MAG: hypothetical protein RIQ79_1363 [Verrucomicrobiota bacterium]|jgi:hypothetical protein